LLLQIAKAGAGLDHCLRHAQKLAGIWRISIKSGRKARAYHAGLEADNRNEIQNWWMESDARIINLATIAFGMGIDKGDVPLRLPLQLAQRAGEKLFAGISRAELIAQLQIKWNYWPCRMTCRRWEETITAGAPDARKRITPWWSSYWIRRRVRRPTPMRFRRASTCANWYSKPRFELSGTHRRFEAGHSVYAAL